MSDNKCARCGRRLKSEKAKALGYGVVCWRKVQAAQAAEEQQKEKESPEATA